MGLTDFFLDYVPMYDKFRAVASILVVAEFTIPLLAMLGLKTVLEQPEVLKAKLKYVYISFALTGGFALLFALMPDVFFGNYISSSEMAMLQDAAGKGYIPQDMLGGILGNLHDMRKAVVVADYDEQVWTYQLTVSNSGEQMTQYGNLAYVRITGLTPETGGDVAITLDEEIRFQSTKPWDYASVDVDFTQAVRAEVVGCFCGHLHRDVLAQVDQVQVAVTTCDGNLAYDTAEDPRTPGTDGEQVLDIVTVNRRDRSVHLTRVGPGTDRSFSY